MSFTMKQLAIALALMATAPLAAQDAPKPSAPEVSAGSIVWWPDFAPAKAVGVEDIWVWLPPSYATSPDRRYPVLYMHDAENIFDRRLSNFDKEWGIDEAITRMSEQGDLREWIVVGLRSPKNRYQVLFPQKLYDFLPDDYRLRVDEIQFAGIEPGYPLRGDDYVRLLADDLKPKVDAIFRTLAGAQDTAVMGSSMGGLMSLYAIAERPDVFGQAAGLSTHLPLAAPEGDDVEGRVRAVTEAFRAYFSASALNPERNHIYIDHGTATLDAFYPPYAKAFDAMMAEQGWGGASYQSRAFFGAEHEENAWAQRVDIPLAFLDRSDP